MPKGNHSNGMSQEVKLQPQRAERALFLGITAIQASVSDMSDNAFPSLGVLSIPGGTQTYKGLGCDRGQALGGFSRNESLEKATLWPSTAHEPPSSQLCHPSQNAPVAAARAGELSHTQLNT